MNSASDMRNPLKRVGETAPHATRFNLSRMFTRGAFAVSVRCPMPAKCAPNRRRIAAE